MTTTEILRAARKRIDRPRKWWQCGGRMSLWSFGRATCAGLAIEEAGRGNNKAKIAAEEIFCRAINRPPSPSSIYRFNDALARTHAEVMAAFDKAIELAEASHA